MKIGFSAEAKIAWVFPELLMMNFSPSKSIAQFAPVQ
jgi:hypothetical protein